MKICGIRKSEEFEYPGHESITVLTNGCNFQCPYCIYKEYVDEPEEECMSSEDFFRFLDTELAQGKNIDGIVITGGEPTTQTDLADFLRWIKGNYEIDTKLETNATNLASVDEILCEGLLDFITVDIKAGPSGFHKATGIALNEELVSNIAEVKKFMVGSLETILPIFPYEFRTTVVGGLHTEEDFKEIGEFIMGAHKYALEPFTDHGKTVPAEGHEFYTPSREELQRYADIVAHYVQEVIIR